MIVVSVIDAFYLTNCPQFLKNLASEQKHSLFGQPNALGLVLSVEINRNMYWKGRLIAVSVIEAGYLTNFPDFFSLEKICRQGNGPQCSTKADADVRKSWRYVSKSEINCHF